VRRRLIVILSSSSSAVQFAGDGVSDVRELLLLLLEIFGGGCLGVLVEPFGGFLNGFKKLYYVSIWCFKNA
jgi:hypothetical protein